MRVKQHKYTQDEIEFFKKFVSGHSYKEIQAAFIEKFGWEITISQIKSSVARYKLNTGRTGRFEKGSKPWNKGMKGTFKGSEKGWFKKGNIPKNRRPVGSERINVDGYIEIKVAEPNKWKLKHRCIWEQQYGKLKETDIITFLDGNKLNLDIKNLVCISRNEHLRLNRDMLRSDDADITKAGISIVKLGIAIKNKAKSKEV